MDRHHEIFPEAGLSLCQGAACLVGIEPGQLLFSEAPKLVDALWVAERLPG